MNPPVCGLCHAPHYAHDPHHFGTEPARVKAPAEPKKKARLRQGLTGDIFIPKGLYDELVRDALLWRKHREKRKAYMQKRRVKK